MVRRTISARRPVFLGCEGESEQAYGIVISDIIKSAVSNVHFEAVLLGEGAGSPLAKIKKAIKKIDHYGNPPIFEGTLEVEFSRYY